VTLTRSARSILGAALCLVSIAGCGPSSPDVRLVSRAIARADSASRGPIPERVMVGLEDLPVAAVADSDSVAWLDINQVPLPHDGPFVCGVPTPPPRPDGSR
jgi:hypothetical protein